MRRAGRTPGDAGTRRRGRITQKVSDGRLAVPMWLRADPSLPRLTTANRRCAGYRDAADCGSAPGAVASSNWVPEKLAKPLHHSERLL